MKEWKLINFDECRECGDSLEGFTDNDKEGWFYDGDDVRCVECDFKSCISVDEEGYAYVQN